MRRGWQVFGLVCAGLMLVIAGGTRSFSVGLLEAKTKSKAGSVGLGVGYRPPEFTASDLSGRSQSLGNYRGKVVVLHFWASWCPYCRKEIPKLTKLYNEWTSKGVQVVTVSTDQDLSKLKQFVQQSGLPYPIIPDSETDPSVADQYGISGIPVTYVINRDGTIAERLRGSSDIVGAVQSVLSPSPTT